MDKVDQVKINGESCTQYLKETGVRRMSLHLDFNPSAEHLSTSLPTCIGGRQISIGKYQHAPQTLCIVYMNMTLHLSL
jgi:hypothetical protein